MMMMPFDAPRRVLGSCACRHGKAARVCPTHDPRVCLCAYVCMICVRVCVRVCTESTAYSCQCSWRSVKEWVRVMPAGELRWVCAGHTS